MDANSLVAITIGNSLWRKLFYGVGIFLFFPIAWLNHFRLLPGSSLFHYLGFLIFFVLSIIAMNKLDDDIKLNNRFIVTIENINIYVLCINIIMYLAAWIAVGGPAFKFFGKYSWIPRLFLLVVYILLLIFNLLSPMMKLYIGCWDESRELVDEEEFFDKKSEST